jgi:flagellar motility protein MotE (MotC chaperone)
MRRIVISTTTLISLSLVVAAYFTVIEPRLNEEEKNLKSQSVRSKQTKILDQKRFEKGFQQVDQIKTLQSADEPGEEGAKNSLNEQEAQNNFDKSAERLTRKQLQLQSKLLDEKIKRLRKVQDEVDGDLSNLRKRRAQKIEKLVKSVEEMRSESAAEFMEVLSQDLAIAILERLSIEQSSKIMNLMSKDKLAQLAEAFVGIKGSRDVAGQRSKDKSNKGGNQ